MTHCILNAQGRRDVGFCCTVCHRHFARTARDEDRTETIFPTTITWEMEEGPKDTQEEEHPFNFRRATHEDLATHSRSSRVQTLCLKSSSGKVFVGLPPFSAKDYTWTMVVEHILRQA